MPRRYTDAEIKATVEKNSLEHVKVLRIIRVPYKSTKVTIKCLDHNIVRTVTYYRAKTTGCKICHYKKTANAEKFSFNKWKSKYEDSWNNKKRLHYDFLQQPIQNNNSIVCLICPKHGKFKISVGSLIYNCSSCPYCIKEKLQNKFQFSYSYVKKYIYNKYPYHFKLLDTTYTNCRKKLHIYYSQMNYDFYMTFSSFKKGYLPPLFRSSTGETILTNIFIDNNIKSISQWKYKSANHTHFFDFYLPTYRTLIEYNGAQHYLPSGTNNLYFDINRKKYDIEKQKIAKFLNMKLIVIPYKYNTPEKIIMFLKSYGIKCSLNKKLDYFFTYKNCSEVAKYYENHSLKNTQKTFNLNSSTIIKYYYLKHGHNKTKDISVKYSIKKDVVIKYYLTHTLTETANYINKLYKQHIYIKYITNSFKQVYGMSKREYLKQKELTKKTA